MATVADARIVLVGGPPGAGKTTFGRALAARTGGRSVTFDDVMVGVRAATTPDSHPAFHPMRPVGGQVPYFTAGSPDAIVADALALEAATKPLVAALVRTYLERDERLVLDWWLLRPRDLAQLDDGRVAAVWIHIDEDALWVRERRNTWTSTSADPERMLANFMHRSLWRNELVAREAAELGRPVLHTDGHVPVDVLVDRALSDTG